MEKTLVEELKALRANGFRLTPKRKALLRLLFTEAGHHFSAQEIFDVLHEDFPAITLATIYNNLHALEQAQAVTSLGFPGREGALYEIEHGPHLNLICRHCGRIEDLDTEELGVLEQRAAASSGYQIEATSYKMIGLCPACRIGREDSSAT